MRKRNILRHQGGRFAFSRGAAVRLLRQGQSMHACSWCPLLPSCVLLLFPYPGLSFSFSSHPPPSPPPETRSGNAKWNCAPCCGTRISSPFSASCSSSKSRRRLSLSSARALFETWYAGHRRREGPLQAAARAPHPPFATLPVGWLGAALDVPRGVRHCPRRGVGVVLHARARNAARRVSAGHCPVGVDIA